MPFTKPDQKYSRVWCPLGFKQPTSGRFADFLPRMVLADFLLESFAGFSRNHDAYSVNIFYRKLI